MAQSNYPLRLQTSLLRSLRTLAKEEGTSVNQLINVAVAEKLSVMTYSRVFAKGDAEQAPSAILGRLARLGQDQLRRGDELDAPTGGDAGQLRLARARRPAAAVTGLAEEASRLRGPKGKAR